MNVRIWLACAFALAFAGLPDSKGQSGFAEQVDTYFWQDQDLINGFQYGNEYLNVLGEPYLLPSATADGYLIIQGVRYDGVRLRFDVFAQRLELFYKMASGAENRIFPVMEHVDGFGLGELNFAYADLFGTPGFYQVLDRGSFVLYAGWTKHESPLSGSTRYIAEFSKPEASFALQRDGRLVPVGGRRDFASGFEPEWEKEIRRYLRKRQFQFRNTNPAALEVTLTGVAELLAKGGGQ